MFIYVDIQIKIHLDILLDVYRNFIQTIHLNNQTNVVVDVTNIPGGLGKNVMLNVQIFQQNV